MQHYFGPQPSEAEWKAWCDQNKELWERQSWKEKWWRGEFEWSMNP